MSDPDADPDPDPDTDAPGDAAPDDKWDFSEHRPLDVELTSGFADLAVVHVNGTQVILEQNEYLPMLVEIYVEDEPNPIGAINVAKGCTVGLGGVEEGLANRIERRHEELETVVAEVVEDLRELEYRLNPEGRSRPDPDGETAEADVAGDGEEDGGPQ